jgi:GNAT superfamily N-acetyltransferase
VRNTDNEEVNSAVREVFEGEFAGLRTADITVSSEGRGSVSVSGGIYDGADQVGTFTRTIHTHPKMGTVTIEHELLKLDPEVQGQGFAEAFNGQLFDWYRESGVDRVELNANIDVGGDAWARAGYDWKNRHAAQTIYGRLFYAVNPTQPDPDDDDPIDDSIENMQRIPADRLAEQLALGAQMLERFEADFDDDDYPIPYELANLGRWPGAGRDDWWIGKAVLMGSDWWAVRKP